MQKIDKNEKVTKWTSETIFGQLILHICLPAIRSRQKLRPFLRLKPFQSKTTFCVFQPCENLIANPSMQDINYVQCTSLKSPLGGASFDAKIKSNGGRGKKLCSIEVWSMVMYLTPGSVKIYRREKL